MEKTEQLVWYAMRATYHRELDAKRALDKQAVENFIPMRYEIRVKNRRKKRELVPAIHNLIFVRTTPAIIKQAKAMISYLQYIVQIEEGKKTPVIVPDIQMQRFIAVAGTHDEQLIYLNPGEIDMAKGTRIRVRGGILDGQEGVFIKVKGINDKRVVILIQGCVAVATATVHPGLIEVIS